MNYTLSDVTVVLSPEGMNYLLLFLLHSDGDTLLFFDFRADRMRQIVEAIGIKPQFDTNTIPKNIVSYSISIYDSL